MKRLFEREENIREALPGHSVPSKPKTQNHACLSKTSIGVKQRHECRGDAYKLVDAVVVGKLEALDVVSS